MFLIVLFHLLHVAHRRIPDSLLVLSLQWLVTVGSLTVFAVLQVKTVANFAQIWTHSMWEGAYAARHMDLVQPIDPGTAYPFRSILVATTRGVLCVLASLIVAERARIR